jgi:phytanoyl-CoA hydroxylase
LSLDPRAAADPSSVTSVNFGSSLKQLTTAQWNQYQSDGYIVVPSLVSESTIARINALLSDWVEGSRSVTEHNAIYDLEPGHSANAPQVRRIKQPHKLDPVFRALLQEPAMLGALHDLLGDALRLHNTKLNLKAAKVGSPVEWHQDWAFYPHTNDDILAIGVMLDDTTEENGAMMMIPGSHKGPTYDHHDQEGYFCGAIDVEAAKLDLSAAKLCTGKVGSVSFHHVRTIHGSAQNHSDRARGLLLYEVCAADAFPLRGIPNYAEFSAHLFAGKETLVPRMVPAPIRMPYPPAKNQGSIYENQRSQKSYFTS